MNAIGRLGASILAFVAATSLLVPSSASAQCVSLTTAGSAVSQNFDTLSNTAGSTTNNLTITGWFMTESGGGARDNEQYAVDTGGSNTGDTYSYGSTASTERALGGLQSGTLIPIFGACFTNNTGVTVTSLRIDYTGEEWRLGTAARTDQINFEYSTTATDLVTGTWTGVAALNFVTPVTATTGAKDGNAAANRTALTSTIASLSIANGATFWIRWTDTNASGADDGLAVDDFSLTPNPGGGPVTPNLTINDVTLAEGDTGTTSFIFTVSLSAPAGAGGVTFDIATADGTAQDDNPVTEDNDYAPQSLTGQTIPAGNSTYSFTVLVNGDTGTEPNETFFVNVTNVTGATVTDGQGTGTINNDDVAITRIHDVQGPGASSPIVGASVTVRAIVTGVRSNGFFIQEEEADYDADPATSEGILVFVGGAPPAAAAVGNLVQVTGTVTEFVPTQDPLQPPLTELTSPAVTLISSGNPLPAPIPLTTTFPDPAGTHDQLERVEGMRVSAASLTVSGPTLGNVNEPNATATSTGVFYGVITGNNRPFREAGIQAPDPPPAGTIPPIPRFDSNPERIRVDSDNLVGSLAVDVGTGAVVSNLVGPMDYTFRTYSINPDPASPPTTSGGPTATAVSVPLSTEFTVAAYNLERFFDTVNDPAIGEPVLTATAFANRLAKGSRGIRNFLRFPDIIGIVECENLSTLQALATQISTDAIANSQPDPLYQAFLVEGNDVGGIDVGFLVKSSIVFGTTPRVEVVAVTQENLGELFVNPDTSTELLNDRPPLVLEAIVHHPSGANFPITVIVNHLRSLNGVADLGAGSSGWPTGGDRVRAKRLKQAESLANLVQARQIADPAEHIIVLGDFNAFEVNDGFGDSMGVIGGTPVPDNETAVIGDGIDLVNPDLVNLASTAPAADRYSFVFDGNAQSLDHVLVNTPLVTDTVARREEHPRVNADFPEVARNDNTSVVRLADHDPVVAYFQVLGFSAADLSVTKTDSPDPVTAGGNLTYTVTINNAGPEPASNASWTDTLPAGTTFVSLNTALGWSCTTPAVGSGGTVSCSNSSFAIGSAIFTLVVNVNASTADGTVLSNTATATSTIADPSSANNSATATTTVNGAADLVTLKTGGPDPVNPGANLTYTITVTNNGPSDAASVTLSDPLPAGTTFVSLLSDLGFTCTTPAVGSGGTVSCSAASLTATSFATFTLVVQVDAGATAGSTITNTATAASTTPDPNTGDEAGSLTVTVGAGSAEVYLTKDDDTDPVIAGSNFSYLITVSNEGPSTASTVSWSDPLPADTTFVSLSAPGGWSCTTPAVGANGTVTCSIASLSLSTAAFTIVVDTSNTLPGGTILTNTATVTSATPDPQPGNESDTETTTIGANTDSLTLTISDNPDPATVGSTTDIEIVVVNDFLDATDATLTVPLAAGTTFEGATSSRGTWACVGPPLGSGGTVTCSAASFPAGTVTFNILVGVGPTFVPNDSFDTTAVIDLTTDGRVEIATDTETTSVLSPAELVAEKTVSGSFLPGDTLFYTVVITNLGPGTQLDNTGDEFVDTLPVDLILLSASADIGTVATGANTVTWNGVLGPGEAVTISIEAQIELTTPPETVIENQGVLAYDGDGDGTNEAAGVTDNPQTGEGGDPTGITVGQFQVLEVPTLGEWGLTLLVGLLALAGCVVLRRRV